MKKTRKKRIVSVILMLSMLFSVCMVTTAASTSAATKNSLRSRGAIRYQEGTESVVIDSADLYTLADRLDVFKVRVTEQLGAIGTYLSTNPNGTALTSEAGIYAVHQKPATSGEADPLSLSFEAILEGIATSQTIPVDPAAYGMESGTTLYIGADGKLNTGNQEGAEQIRIQAATAENLSAGTAAWVNGQLILGTGGDNKAYHDLGYQEGSDSQNSGGGTGSGNVNRARVINMNNGTKSYVVQEDMTDVFLCFSRVGGRTTPVLSSGESIKHVVQSTLPANVPAYFLWDLYYVPKLTKGTVISNLYSGNAENMSMLITIEGSKKDGKVNSIPLVSNYVVETDLTDVFLYTSWPKRYMPDFIPMDDQKYVSFKLLKDVTYVYNDAGNTVSASLYYIPELKAGTKISNINSACSYLVY